jgi:hypothetical protein
MDNRLLNSLAKHDPRFVLDEWALFDIQNVYNRGKEICSFKDLDIFLQGGFRLPYPQCVFLLHPQGEEDLQQIALFCKEWKFEDEYRIRVKRGFIRSKTHGCQFGFEKYSVVYVIQKDAPPKFYIDAGNDTPLNGSDQESEEIEHAMRHTRSHLTLLASLLLLNCSRVEKQRISFAQAHAKKRIQQGKLPLRSYYVLKIPLFKTRKKGESLMSYSRRLREHDVRGHWKIFDEKMLFGKTRGRFFWLPQKRGDKGLGEIRKDYLL